MVAAVLVAAGDSQQVALGNHLVAFIARHGKRLFRGFGNVAVEIDGGATAGQ